MSNILRSQSAPAKFNRYLGVLGRRPDGFHEVELVTTVLDGLPELTDTLTSEPAEEISLHLEGPASAGLVADESNLVLRAWRKIESLAGSPCPARLTLHKRIPHGAGLGGGSSDGAAALRLAERMFGLDLGLDRLLEVAAELGSDVPLFLLGGTVHGTGRGEKVASVKADPLPPMLLLNPGLHVPTPAVYRAMAEVGYPGTAPLPDPSAPPWRNDLEPAALRVCPPLLAIRQALADSGGEPLLCGSGSTWAARYPGVEARDRALALLREAMPHAGLWRV